MILSKKAIRIIFEYISIRDIYKLILVSREFFSVYRNSPVALFLNKIPGKWNKLRAFVWFHRYLPIQGSIAWKNARTGSINKPPTVGGSEMYKLIHNPRELIDSKLNVKPFYGNIHTRWGNIMEELPSSIFDWLFDTSSSELGSIPGMRDENENVIQTYSPDKLMLMKKERLREILFADFNCARKEYEIDYNRFHSASEEEIIVLAEFKCPSVRIPDGSIPKDYIYQPPTGACTIPIVDISLFSNVAIRKCAIEEFDMSTAYDCDFHVKDLQNNPGGFGAPLFMSFIGIYDTTPPTSVRFGRNSSPPITANKNIENNPMKEIENNPINFVNFVDIVKRLEKEIMNDISQPGSEYFGLDISYKNIIRLILLCHKFLKYILESEFGHLRHLNVDYYNIILQTLISLLNLTPDVRLFVYEIIPETIRMSEEKERGEQKFGYDLGNRVTNANNLDMIFERVLQTRGMNSAGYKAFYCPGMIVNEAILKETGIKQKNIPENYLDPTLTGRDKYQKWLHRNMGRFHDFCCENNYHLVGVLPWKLFKMAIIPVFNEPNFLASHYSDILQVTNLVYNLKKTAHEKYPGDLTGMQEYYREELDMIYNPKRTFTRKSSRNIRGDTYAFAQDFVNEFNDL